MAASGTCQHSFQVIKSDTTLIVWNCQLCHSGPHWYIYECRNLCKSGPQHSASPRRSATDLHHIRATILSGHLSSLVLMSTFRFLIRCFLLHSGLIYSTGDHQLVCRGVSVPIRFQSRLSCLTALLLNTVSPFRIVGPVSCNEHTARLCTFTAWSRQTF
ncbi:hypothetical protein EJ05DRAFT_205445 [Pseudovirgaria hyperparasitica]|uniref:Uncharacterized protein n=1 Tax=Pseudovirgaria hyperparasitica TaxID=470096 RepID=A0A6A6WHP7_9PEZI|nr:uncharacterized protein EJ05DRAFT_205445 [Pseudovirgaria hyperparasitica]KAF2762318.1 hypothetical protein EJ05DRAFT_205445 [Pseudovirgaria hyperparasitica]